MASVFTPISQGEELIAIVGSGENTFYPKNEVVIINQVSKAVITRLQFDEASTDCIINMMITKINTFAVVFR